ncbi:hypothetical protein HDU96_000568 [Phlyctochytrium bullatum]|nr:hypothetical protein HDU96_000568 [Phlyctochytrium bullatum]
MLVRRKAVEKVNEAKVSERSGTDYPQQISFFDSVYVTSNRFNASIFFASSSRTTDGSFLEVSFSVPSTPYRTTTHHHLIHGIVALTPSLLLTIDRTAVVFWTNGTETSSIVEYLRPANLTDPNLYIRCTSLDPGGASSTHVVTTVLDAPASGPFTGAAVLVDPRAGTASGYAVTAVPLVGGARDRKLAPWTTVRVTPTRMLVGLASGHIADHRFDSGSWVRVSTCRAHTKDTRMLRVLPRNRWLVSCGYDGRVRVWDLDALPVSVGHQTSVAASVAEYAVPGVGEGGDRVMDFGVDDEETAVGFGGVKSGLVVHRLVQRGGVVLSGSETRIFGTTTGFAVQYVMYWGQRPAWLATGYPGKAGGAKAKMVWAYWGEAAVLAAAEMDQTTTLANMASADLETLLEILKESRLLTEAETRRQEELRKIKELDLAVLKLQHPPDAGSKVVGSHHDAALSRRGLTASNASSGDPSNSSPLAVPEGLSRHQPTPDKDHPAIFVPADDLLQDSVSQFLPSPPKSGFLGFASGFPADGYHSAAVLTPDLLLQGLPASTSAVPRMLDSSILGFPGLMDPSIVTGTPVPSILDPSIITPVPAIMDPSTITSSSAPANKSMTPFQPLASTSMPSASPHGFLDLSVLHSSPTTSNPPTMTLDFLDELLALDLSAPVTSSVSPIPAKVFPSPGEALGGPRFTSGDQRSSDLLPANPGLPPPVSSVPRTPRSPLPPAPSKPTTSPTDDLPSLNLSRASIRRRTRCLRCHRGVCVFLLYGSKAGSPPSLDSVAAAEDRVFCTSCFKAREGDSGGAKEEAAAAATGKQRKRRVRKVTQSTPLKCDACTREIGVGGLRMTEEGDREREGEWVEPPFGVEAICDYCVKHFDFCTQCGGGGAFRTGKWRPRELFLPGRRNCTLSHIRYGSLPRYQVSTLRCALDASAPPDPSPVISVSDSRVHAATLARFHGREPTGSELLSWKATQVCELFKETLLVACATPQHMTSTPLTGNIERLMARIDIGVQELQALIVGPRGDGGVTPLSSQHVRRYLCVIDAVKSQQRPPRGKRGAGGDAPTAPASPPIDDTPPAPTEDDEEPDLFLGAFDLHQWDLRRRHVYILQCSFVQRGSLRDRIFTGTAIADRIEHEAQAEGLPKPQFAWHWFYRVWLENPILGGWGGEMVSMLRGMGFKPVKEFCEMWKEDTERIKEGMALFRSEVDVARGIKDEIEFLVMRWEDLRALQAGKGVADKEP